MNMQLQLSKGATEAYTSIDDAFKNEITREIKKQTQALTFNLISGFHLIAGFKAEIRAGLMKKQKELTNMGLIKDEAMEIEAILEESKKKSAVGTNGSRNNDSYGNGNKPILINQIEENDLNVDAIRGNNYKNNYNSSTQQGNKNGPIKCVYCKKPGQSVNKCFTKFPALRPQNQQKQNNNNQGQSNTTKRYCTYCEKEGHLTNKCFNLERTIKKINASTIHANGVQNEQENTPSKN